MDSIFNINRREIRKTKIGVTEFRISVFLSDKLEFQFKVSLQSTGNDEALPMYQLIDKTQSIPKWMTERMQEISDWLIQSESKISP